MTRRKNYFIVLANVLASWPSLQKTYRLQYVFWVAMSLILWWKIKWSGQRLTGIAPCMPASRYLGTINMAERSASKDEEDKCSCQSIFFQTPIIQHWRANARQGQQLSHSSIYTKKSHPCYQPAERKQWLKRLNAKYLKVVLHYALPHAVVAKCIQIMKYWLQLAVAECEGWHNNRFEEA